jgi:hypothetical protein
MKELKSESLFPRQSTTVTIQCSGTRRIEQIQEYPGDGDELINAPVRYYHILTHQNPADYFCSGEKARSELHNGPVYHSRK